MEGSAVDCSPCGNKATNVEEFCIKCNNIEKIMKKERWVYILLGIFAGGYGVHNFYAGYFRKGFAQLIYSISIFVVSFCVFIFATYNKLNAITLLYKILFIFTLGIILWVLSDIVKTKKDANNIIFQKSFVVKWLIGLEIIFFILTILNFLLIIKSSGSLKNKSENRQIITGEVLWRKANNIK